MKFRIVYASCSKEFEDVEINTMEELKKIVTELWESADEYSRDSWDTSCVVNFDENKVTIYDDYLE